MSDLVKQAERNLVNIAKHFEDTMQIVEALQMFGEQYCNDFIGLKEFREGMSIVRSSLYKELVHAQSQCFIFSGVGGEEAAKYSKELFEEQFGDKRYCVVQFLHKNGKVPDIYLTGEEEEEETLREQCKEIIKEGM